jgi:nitrite reductase/ring-hydroxylating ferredoxin subunit
VRRRDRAVGDGQADTAVSQEKRFVRVVGVDELPEGATTVVEVEGRDLMIVNVAGSFYAVDNRCPHMGGPLNRGRVEGRAIVCPWHDWRWDVKTGRALSPPVDWRAVCYPVVVEEGQVLVRVA